MGSAGWSQSDVRMTLPAATPLITVATAHSLQDANWVETADEQAHVTSRHAHKATTLRAHLEAQRALATSASVGRRREDRERRDPSRRVACPTAARGTSLHDTNPGQNHVFSVRTDSAVEARAAASGPSCIRLVRLSFIRIPAWWVCDMGPLTDGKGLGAQV